MSRLVRKYKIWKAGRMFLCKALKWNNSYALLKKLCETAKVRLPYIEKYSYEMLDSTLHYCQGIMLEDLHGHPMSYKTEIHGRYLKWTKIQ